MFTLQAESHKNVTVLRYLGDMLLPDVPQFSRQLEAHLLAPGIKQVILDLSHVDKVDSSGLGVLVKHTAGVGIRPGIFQGDDFSEHLTVNSVLDVPQAIDVRRAVLSARFEVEVVEIGIEVMPQVVLHHAPSVKPVSMRPGGQSAASGI